MYESPNLERLQKLSFDEKDIGKDILYCHKCDFQYSPGIITKPICPNCKNRMYVTTLTKELYKLIITNRST